jgi:hypothetical protein
VVEYLSGLEWLSPLRAPDSHHPPNPIPSLPPTPTPTPPSPFIISPRITFEVSVRVLGGLMALGYEIGTIMRRRSVIYKSADEVLQVKLDEIENLGEFVQVVGGGALAVLEGRGAGVGVVSCTW